MIKLDHINYDTFIREKIDRNLISQPLVHGTTTVHIHHGRDCPHLSIFIFFGGGRGSNPGPCIFYALSIPTELSSRGLNIMTLITNIKNS